MEFNSNVTVLYLDDEIINLKVIELTLGRYFNVLIFSNVTDALNEISKNSNITHVISDLLMPDTNGVEFIKKVKTLNNSVKCYIHSGVNITDEIREALSKKLIDDFFEKPLNISYIYNSITSFEKINLP
ncbi:MAG: response regulator [Flavobacteriaceae bacterium]